MGRRGPGHPGPSAGHSGGEDRLAALIAQGLTDQAQHPVDVESLIVGAHTGARRIRRRRTATRIAAAAVVIAAVPAGLDVTHLFGTGGASVTAVSGSSGLSTFSGSVEAGGRGDTSGGDAASAGGDSPFVAGPSPSGTALGSTRANGTGLSRDGTGQVLIPDAAVLQVSDVSVVRLQPGSDKDTVSPAGPTANPVCAQASTAVSAPAGVRQLGYRSSSGTAAWTLTTRVQVLAGGAADAELNWLRRSMGYCASALRLSRAPVAGVPGDGVALGYQVGVGSQPHAVLVVGVVRQGRTTASVELVVPASAGGGDEARSQLALDQARHLLALADRRLLSSGLAPCAAADPALAS
ncbi:MAG TPA: hypothetical protein VFP72_00845 [Kineosporiaceae bacterium]|nr:hypothetical protein [Kineosporiaceae bacterium]